MEQDMLCHSKVHFRHRLWVFRICHLEIVNPVGLCEWILQLDFAQHVDTDSRNHKLMFSSSSFSMNILTKMIFFQMRDSFHLIFQEEFENNE